MHKKLNNKGYMLVEIIVASVIAFSVAYFLLNLTYKFKNKNMDVYESTNLLSAKINITKNIMNDLNDKNITSINKKDDKNITFKVDGIDKAISITNKTIKYGPYNGTAFITGDKSYYEKELPSYVDIGNISTPNNSIKIPISDIYSNNNYNINISTSNYDWTPSYHVFYEGIGGFINEKNDTKKYFEYDGLYNNLSAHDNNIAEWQEFNGKGTGAKATIKNKDWGNNYLNSNANNTYGIISSLTFNKNDHKKFSVESTFELEKKTSTSDCYLIGNIENGGVGLGINKEGIPIFKVYFEDEEKTLEATAPVQLNVKYHIVGTYDGETLKIYINGILNNFVNKTGTLKEANNNTVMAIGCNPSGQNCTGGFFKGKIYNASFNIGAANEDTIKNSSGKDVKIGEKYGDLPEPIRGSNYKFNGWVDKEGNTVTKDTIVTDKKDHTIYAKWTK